MRHIARIFVATFIATTAIVFGAGAATAHGADWPSPISADMHDYNSPHMHGPDGCRSTSVVC